MSIGTIILIILVIALLGGFSGVGGGPFYGTGYYIQYSRAFAFFHQRCGVLDHPPEPVIGRPFGRPVGG